MQTSIIVSVKKVKINKNTMRNFLLYLAMVLILLIQFFDKEDKYFIVQVVILALLIIYTIFSWLVSYKNKKNNE